MGAAVRVFEVTELFENIMLRVDGMGAKMSARGVCKQWKGMIESSLLVRRTIFLAPASASDSGMDIFAPPPKLAAQAKKLGCTTSVMLPHTMKLLRKKSGDLGSLVRGMYVTQPPVTATLLYLKTSDFNDDTPVPGQPSEIYLGHGETVGSLRDKIDSLGCSKQVVGDKFFYWKVSGL